MKKICLCALALVSALVFAACSGGESNEEKRYTDEAGNNVTEDEKGCTIFAKSLPTVMDYNGKNVQLTSVDLYESVVDHSYYLYIVTTLDASDLTDDEFYWLHESDLETICYITSEENEYDFDRAPNLGCLYDEDAKTIQYVSMSDYMKENRYSFAGSKLTVVATTTQKEQYEYENKDGDTRSLDKENEIMYSIDVESDLLGVDEIPNPLHDNIARWLYDKADYYSLD